MRILRAMIEGFKPIVFALGIIVIIVNLIQNVMRGTDYLDFLVVALVLLLSMVLVGSYRLDRTEYEKLNASEVRIVASVGSNMDLTAVTADVARFIRDESWRWRIEDEA